MNQTSLEQTPIKRRRYSTQFKRQVVEACLAGDASVAKIALAHGLNANMVHRWIRQAKHSEPAANTGFVALPVPRTMVSASPLAGPAAGAESIRMAIPYRHQSITLSFPVSQMDRCVALLRELLR